MADSTSFELIDNSGAVLDALEEQVLRSLERCGLQAEGYAKDLAPVDTGNLRNSVTHTVVPEENAVYIGTNVEYGVYQELGTGIHVQGGRRTPWSYVDAKGEGHTTRGNPPQPFIKPAVAEHAQTYQNIFEDELKNG